MSQQTIEKLLSKVDDLRGESIDLLKDLIAINSVGPANDGPGEQSVADYLESYLHKIGFEQIKNYPASDPRVEGGERPNLVAVLEGKEQSKTLWILTHTDIVPPGDLTKWDHDPFQPLVKDDKIYGRGSEDNHQGTVSSILTARAFIETKLKPEINIGLVFMADEETGSGFGLGHLLKHHAHIFKKDDLLIIPDAGEPDAGMIEVAEKSILWLKFKTVGKQVHASTPEQGINAFRAASDLVVRLDALHDQFPARDDLFSPPVSTFEPTKKEANVPNINTIPGDDVFYLDCRILPDYNLQEVMEAARRMADEVEKAYHVKVDISTVQKEQSAPPTSPDAPVVGLLTAAVREIYQVEAKAMGIGGGTVAALFRREGYPVAVWSTIDDMAHQPNEYCRINNMLNDAKVFVYCVQNSVGS